jgi:hypothetical protein
MVTDLRNPSGLPVLEGMYLTLISTPLCASPVADPGEHPIRYRSVLALHREVNAPGG